MESGPTLVFHVFQIRVLRLLFAYLLSAVSPSICNFSLEAIIGREGKYLRRNVSNRPATVTLLYFLGVFCNAVDLISLLVLYSGLY